MSCAQIILLVRYLESIINTFEENYFAAENLNTTKTEKVLYFDEVIKRLSEYKETLNELYDNAILKEKEE